MPQANKTKLTKISPELAKLVDDANLKFKLGFIAAELEAREELQELKTIAVVKELELMGALEAVEAQITVLELIQAT